ncbi:MAG: M56 family metallopeptidase [Microscillaceae bacterium]|nr:M56 family metallopeptidase [Microscillaceae bacterium]MDW8459791.1 M56 family metallopeptidase [Cytophagales bacterium]
MEQIFQFFNTNMAEALGWAILHSLWQGGVIAFLLFIVLLVLRKSPSQARYLMALVALFSIFLIWIFTFIYIFHQLPMQKLPTMVQPDNSPAIVIISTETHQTKLQTTTLLGYYEWVKNYFYKNFYTYFPILVLAWLLGVVLMSVRFLGSLWYLQRLRYYKVHTVSEAWQQKLRKLAQKIGIQRSVQLVESAMVEVPMVLGHFKPLILLPLGALVGLSAQQIESILAHELAHIRRHDYLVNLLQSLIEIVLFFNPFVWWVNQLIRTERENCCDDIAIKLTGDTLTFAKTLATLEEIRQVQPRHVMAFLGQRNRLPQRIKRILYQTHPKTTFGEGFVAAVIALCFFLSASLYAQYQPKKIEKEQKESAKIEEKYIKEKSEKALAVLPKKVSGNTLNQLEKENVFAQKLEDTLRIGKKYKVVRKGNDYEIYREGVLIPKQEYEKYKNDFEVKDGQIYFSPQTTEGGITLLPTPQVEQKEGKELHIYMNDKDNLILHLPTLPAPPTPSIILRGSPQEFQIFMDKDSLWSEKLKKGSIKIFSKIDTLHSKTSKMLKEMQIIFKMDSLNMQLRDFIQKNYEIREKILEDWRKKRDKYDFYLKYKNFDKPEIIIKGWKEKPKSKYYKGKPKSKNRAEDTSKTNNNHLLKTILQDLITDKVLPEGSKSFTLELRNNELWVNNKKQPKELYEKYYKKIVKQSLQSSRGFEIENGKVDLIISYSEK